MIDTLDKKVISKIQGDLPIVPKPYAAMAEEVGITEGEFIERIMSVERRPEWRKPL